MERISGFSKLSKEEKILWLSGQFKGDSKKEFLSINNFWHEDQEIQKLFDEFSENTITNFIFPYGICPKMLINDKIYNIPLVIEESSVVAACSKSAKFWMEHGGFKTKILSTTKKGQVHFLWSGESSKLFHFFSLVKSKLLINADAITQNMEKRGGGIKDVVLVDKTHTLENYYQLDVSFETCDAMGANFINTVLEKFGEDLKILARDYDSFNHSEKDIDVIMCILSNYTPECTVTAYVECHIDELDHISSSFSGREFASRFEKAVNISKIDVNRAVTHNKGIFNGIDALVIATGNDFRAIEACGHAYAARDGQYRGLSSCTIKDDIFRFELTIPLAVGTVGGLTKLHPMAKVSLKLLNNPNAKDLMGLIACIGLAQNFGALRSLVTTGIQKGHMKMHLLNILNQLGASKDQITTAKNYFKHHTVSFQAVRDFLEQTQNFH